MRADRPIVYRYRAVFGAGFLALGAVTLWRIVLAPGPAGSKVWGVLFALALIGLGAARVAQYFRARRDLR
jgi:hypothetical protein